MIWWMASIAKGSGQKRVSAWLGMALLVVEHLLSKHGLWFWSPTSPIPTNERILLDLWQKGIHNLQRRFQFHKRKEVFIVDSRIIWQWKGDSKRDKKKCNLAVKKKKKRENNLLSYIRKNMFFDFKNVQKQSRGHSWVLLVGELEEEREWGRQGREWREEGRKRRERREEEKKSKHKI